MKKYFILLLLLLVSCDKKSRNSEEINYKNEKDMVNYYSSIKEFSVRKVLDFVTSKGEQIFLSPATIIKSYKNRVYFYDKFKIYVTDSELNVQQIISLKEKDYMFKGKISDIEIIENSIFILDRSNKIKKIAMESPEKIDEIELDNKGTYRGDYYGMTYIGDNCLLLTAGLLPLSFNTNNSGIEVGKVFELNGRYKFSITIPIEKADVESWKEGGDITFSANFKKLLYFSFSTSRNIYVFNSSGELLKVFQLAVDKKYWFEPKISLKSVNIAGREQSVTSVKFVIQYANNLQIADGYTYQIMYKGTDKSPSLIKYNLKFEIVESLDLKNIAPGMGYKIYLINDRILLVHNSIFYIVGK